MNQQNNWFSKSTLSEVTNLITVLFATSTEAAGSYLKRFVPFCFRGLSGQHEKKAIKHTFSAMFPTFAFVSKSIAQPQIEL